MLTKNLNHQQITKYGDFYGMFTCSMWILRDVLFRYIFQGIYDLSRTFVSLTIRLLDMRTLSLHTVPSRYRSRNQVIPNSLDHNSVQ